MDWAMGVYVRLHESGAVSPAEKFVNGPNGFKMAVWKDGDMVESEISNIDAPELPVVFKKPAKSQARMTTTASDHVMKKPAAAPTLEASADAEEQEEEEEAAQEQADDEHVQCISDGEAADEAPVEAAPGALGEADDEQLLSFSGFVHPLLGALSGGCYAKQSYFTAKAPGDLKKRLVVAVSEVQTGQHSIVCNKLFRWALANPQANKESIILKRAEFLIESQ
jgi:hypothetical protein